MSKSAPRAVRTEPAPSTEMQSSRRQWLTEEEVERLIKATECQRDGLMILMAYRHGLRVSELVALQWGQVDLGAGRLAVRRVKGGEDGVHPLSGREVRWLRALRREQPVGSRFVFVTRLGGPFTRDGFAKLLSKVGDRAGIPDVHPHLLRHATGFKLVNQGMDTLSLAAYLGHRNVNNTRRYTRMNATRFDGIWKD
jgi:type 1 fimbriae regulatory protein FimB/type 1 fimbriae regulatory protein FimE